MENIPATSVTVSGNAPLPATCFTALFRCLWCAPCRQPNFIPSKVLCFCAVLHLPYIVTSPRFHQSYGTELDHFLDMVLEGAKPRVTHKDASPVLIGLQLTN